MEPMLTQAEEFKNSGNRYFTEKNYKQAIIYYEKSLNLDPQNPVYYFNTARCYANLSEWREAEKYSKFAIEKDPKYIKAIYLHGICMVEIGKFSKDLENIDTGISEINHASTLCTGQNKKQFEADANKSLKYAKKIRWLKNHELLTEEGVSLADYLGNLIRKENISEEEKSKRIKNIRKELMPKKKTKADIPEYLLCDLTKNIMNDPVITSAGYTYERQELMKFLSENGNIDPITKEKINQYKIFPNINIKLATEEFLSKQPWAFDYKGDLETYKEIKLE